MRTDHDTWDITTSVGSTALFVAAARALEAQKSEPLVVDPFAEVFCRAVGGEWADLLDGGAPDHELKSEFGVDFVNFQGARTKYFDTYFLRAAGAGVRQIVLLAAGLDSRAYRIDWPAGTVVYELDQPQVLEFKCDALAGCRPNATRREVPVDLRDDWPRALQQRGFDLALPSAWIVEGLMIYLSASAQVQLFTGIDALSAPGSHAALEENAPMDAAVFAVRVDAELVAADSAHSRPFFQLLYNEQYEPAAQWFGARGWRAETTPLLDYLRALGRRLPVVDPQNGYMPEGISLVSAIKG